MPDARLAKTRALYHVKPLKPAPLPKLRHDGRVESSHQGNPGRKPIMRHG